MKTIVIIFVISIAVVTKLGAIDAFESRSLTENVWMPTGYTLNAGEYKIDLNSTIGLGINDRVQLNSSVVSFLLQRFNIDIKTQLIRSPKLALAAGFDFQRYYLEVDAIAEHEAKITFAPYVAASKPINETRQFHASFQVCNRSSRLPDLNQLNYNPVCKSSFIAVGVEEKLHNHIKILSEIGHDFTYHGIKFAGSALVGWQRLRVKAGLGYFKNLNNDKGKVLVVLGMWWRFAG
ncbi:hypothetical protein JW960_29040 [candidate division KSB1 bacterium]|nr:hypothetical protein [candidate division KSB1 bacterium]